MRPESVSWGFHSEGVSLHTMRFLVVLGSERCRGGERHGHLPLTLTLWMIMLSMTAVALLCCFFYF